MSCALKLLGNDLKKIDIVHIYSGTSGIAGTYLNTIYETLKKTYSQELFVNYFYPFSEGKKIFYKHTELAGKNYFKNFNLFRFFLRFLELFNSLVCIFFFVFQKKPKYINYSLTSDLYLEYFFLRLIKTFSISKIIITCHDVIPNANSYSDIEKSIKKRKLFFDLADKLLVHNSNSRLELIERFNTCENKIISHLFPIMDLSSFSASNNNLSKNNEVLQSDKKKLLFIGHMRKEKGVELLLEAWSRIDRKNMHLTVAGNIPPGFSYNFDKVDDSNFSLIDDFVSDHDFINLIKKSDFVILPYTRGTNSGIPSSIMSLGGIPLVSDIPMFINNDLIDSQLLFDSGSVSSLSNKLIEVSFFSKSDMKKIRMKLEKKYIDYKHLFETSILNAYDSLDFL